MNADETVPSLQCRIWHEAARLQEEALCLARSLTREALVRYQIGRRLFDEALLQGSGGRI